MDNRRIDYACDVLCIGGGGAAVTAAVEAARRGADVILVSKEPLGYGDTRLSMGMIAVPGIDERDTPDVFFRDLRAGGEGISDPVLVGILAGSGPESRLISENFGHLYRRDGEGKISPQVTYLTGGHSIARTIGCPPSAGVGIGNALRSAVVRSGVRALEETAAYKLLTDGNRAAGAVCLDLVSGEPVVITARTVVMAAGGGGWLYYPHTGCANGVTGDSFSLAYEAGAELKDMEQVQFLPFAVTHPSSLAGLCIGDSSIAGPNGVLRDKDGNVVLENVARRTRAAVTRVIADCLHRGLGTEYGGILLDHRPNLETEAGRREWERCRVLGQLDIIRAAYGDKAYRWEEPWDVAPTAHYFLGGIRVGGDTESSLPGLYAAGQAMAGLFGANRLGASSLTEIFVFGRIAGEAAAEQARELPLPDVRDAGEAVGELTSLYGRKGSESPTVLQRRLQKLMWDKVGICREERGLCSALREIEAIRTQSADIAVPSIKAYNPEALHAVELKHMLTCAELVVRSALTRRETRGAHIRLDYPERDDQNWLCNIVVRSSGGGPEIRIDKGREAE